MLLMNLFSSLVLLAKWYSMVLKRFVFMMSLTLNSAFAPMD